MSERERFEKQFPIPENSDIAWYEDRGQYLTATPMWKITARGMTHALQGWQARADLAAEERRELVGLLKKHWRGKYFNSISHEDALEINEALAKYKEPNDG